MGVEKKELARQLCQLSCASQTRMRAVESNAHKLSFTFSSSNVCAISKSTRVVESLRSKASENCNSHEISSSFMQHDLLIPHEETLHETSNSVVVEITMYFDVIIRYLH
jgi:hypothetical protein